MDVRLIVAEVLVHAPRWEHRVGAAGASITVDLPGGGQLSSSSTDAVVNRLTHVPLDLRHVAAADRAYARDEVNAFYASWLRCFRLVVNPSSPDGLCGRDRHPFEWAALARLAGFAVSPISHSIADPVSASVRGNGAVAAVTVVGDEVIPPVERSDAEAAKELSRTAGLPVLGIELERRPGARSRFVSATPIPDLRAGGEGSVDALCRLLQGPSAR
ncbi:MAG: hypothetical protein HY908_18365 [Myxococcales bacterium]|nr:hypothetical protein [Myxococcales bacterium]